MTGWIVLACVVAFATKLIGYFAPPSVLDEHRTMAVLSATTIGLLGALIAINAATSQGRLALDSRLLAVVAAAIALRLRAPFIVVVLVGAGVVALARAFGLP